MSVSYNDTPGLDLAVASKATLVLVVVLECLYTTCMDMYKTSHGGFCK